MTFHVRPPSIDKGVVAFLWTFGFFLYVRIYGEDRPGRAG